MIARLVAPGGRLELTISVVGRDADAASGLDRELDRAARERMASDIAARGLELAGLRPLTPADLAPLQST